MRPLLAVLLFSTASLAFAHNCPNEMKAIDARLQGGTSLSAEELKKVKDLRAKGEQLHKAGKHDESMQALGDAKQILGM